MRLDGRVAIVSGGTSGMGAAAARGLAAEGATVVVGGRNRGRGTALADEIGGIFQPADVTRVADCRALAQRAVDELGRVDVLVNCAGILPLGSITEVTEEGFDEAWRANVKGTFFCGQAVIPHMLEQGRGKIVNFTSVAGLAGVAGGSVYCTTKGAIVTMTKAWAVELAPHGLNVNAIAPGTVETPMNEAFREDPAFDAMTRGATPQGRNGQVDDVVPMVVFLASDDAKWMNGSIVAVDGGWLAT
ncbi:MAG TPA: glucose 1-dehydrogenase [Gaiellaceae bacterium]|nr:glucose 1-dehydrogenase [Gaiellaceae bacterium]